MFESLGSFFHFLHQDCVSQIRLDYRAFTRILSLLLPSPNPRVAYLSFTLSPKSPRICAGYRVNREEGTDTTRQTPRHVRCASSLSASSLAFRGLGRMVVIRARACPLAINQNLILALCHARHAAKHPKTNCVTDHFRIRRR